MRLSLFPKTPDVISRLTNMLLCQNEIYIDYLQRDENQKPTTSNRLCVGVVTIKEPSGQEIKLSIFLDEGHFKKEYPLDVENIPLAYIIKTIDDKLIILINSRSYALYNAPTTRIITMAVICHELGHLLSNRLLVHNRTERDGCSNDDFIARIDRSPVNIAENVIIPLLDGYYGDEFELEADIIASSIIGIEGIIAYRVLLSQYIDNVGVKILNHNRVSKLLELLNTTPELFKECVDYNIQISITNTDGFSDLHNKKTTKNEVGVETEVVRKTYTALPPVGTLPGTTHLIRFIGNEGLYCYGRTLRSTWDGKLWTTSTGLRIDPTSYYGEAWYYIEACVEQ